MLNKIWRVDASKLPEQFVYFFEQLCVFMQTFPQKKTMGSHPEWTTWKRWSRNAPSNRPKQTPGWHWK